MKKRLTDTKRANLEQRLLKLRAYLEPGKVGNIVDAVGPDQADIKSVVEKIMALMDAQDGAGKYHTASAKKKLEAALKFAFDAPMSAPPSEPDESPMEEEQDLQNPVMHQVEDLEHEVQTMDDETLMQEVQALEERMKQDLHLQGGGEGGAPEAPMASPAMAAPKSPVPAPAAPKPPTAEGSDELPAEEESDDEAPELKPEQKMALLLSLPKTIRAKKAANLRALAGVLDADTREVSNENDMNGGENDALANDYDSEEEGSMKDVQAGLKAKLASLIKAAEDATEEAESEKDDDEKKEAVASALVITLALKHLQASMDEESEEKEDEPEEKGEDDKPDFLKDAYIDDKKAILKARLASLRRNANNTADPGMKTPKEVPSPSGTTEDNLKGDAPTPYANALGGTSLSEIQERRQKLPSDKSTAGDANEVYFSNAPENPKDRATSEKDSSPSVNNKRVLKDEGVAVQKDTPAAGKDAMEMGAGSHQNPKDWEKAKSESDTTPTGDRLVGLAQIQIQELVALRTTRAMKLATKMADAGQIRNEDQLTDQVIKLASMDDAVFEQVAAYFESTLTPLKKKAGEIPPQFMKKDEEEAEEKDDKDEPDEEDEMPKTANRRVARRNENYEDDTIRHAASVKPSRGIKAALNLGSIDAPPSMRGTPIFNKVASLGWTDAISAARGNTELDDLLFEGRPRQ